MPVIQPFPSIPQDCIRIDMRWSLQQFPPVAVRVCRLSWMFSSVNPLPPGYNPMGDFASASLAWVHGVTLDMAPSGIAFPQYWVFLRTATATFKQLNPYLPAGALQGDFASYDLCSVFLKRAVSSGPNWRGRAHFFPVPKSFLSADGSYSNGGYAKLRNAAAAMKNGMTMNGEAFKSVVYSPTLNGTSPIDHVDVCSSPRTLYRRRLTRDRLALPYVF
jgi:hypothetical protein